MLKSAPAGVSRSPEAGCLDLLAIARAYIHLRRCSAGGSLAGEERRGGGVLLVECRALGLQQRAGTKFTQGVARPYRTPSLTQKLSAPPASRPAPWHVDEPKHEPACLPRPSAQVLGRGPGGYRLPQNQSPSCGMRNLGKKAPSGQTGIGQGRLPWQISIITYQQMRLASCQTRSNGCLLSLAGAKDPGSSGPWVSVPCLCL